MDWNKFAMEIHKATGGKDAQGHKMTFDTLVCECCARVGRAYEEHGKGRPNVYHLCEPSNGYPCDKDLGTECKLASGDPCEHRETQPRGVAVELANCVLKILDYLATTEDGVGDGFDDIPIPKDFTRVVCDLYGMVASARASMMVQGHRLKAEGELCLCVEIILAWGKSENVDMEDLLRKLADYNKTHPFQQ